MKITVVITRADVIGGASVHVLDLAKGLQESGHTVEVLVGGSGVFINKAKAIGINCTSLKYLRRDISILNDFLGFFELRKELSLNKPDIVHLHSTKAGVLGRLAANAADVPSVFTAHGWAFTDGIPPLRRFFYLQIERLMALFTNKVITVSDFDKKLALRLGVGNEALITTVHNGIPSYPVVRKDFKNDVIKMIMVARFDNQKDHQTLINAISRVECNNWHLELVGDGPLLDGIVKHVESLGLSGKVSFSGSCDDVATRLLQSDVFLLISNWEGLPLTILEAMRAGLPVIASSVGGVSEAVAHGSTGVLVPRGDVHALAESITLMLENESFRLSCGHAGRVKFDAEFVFDVMLEKTESIYREVLNKN